MALYGDGQRALLASAGFGTTTLIEDLASEDRRDRGVESRAAVAPRVSALPTGREAYRVYEDYTTELKDLAEANPALVRPVVLGTSFEGRPIEGIEIATEVNRSDDGRPVYLNFGTHHAREWPSGEFPMEFAHDLVAGLQRRRRRGSPSLLGDVRVVIVPVVNPDGFIASRSFGTSPLGRQRRRQHCRRSSATRPPTSARTAARPTPPRPRCRARFAAARAST